MTALVAVAVPLALVTGGLVTPASAAVTTGDIKGVVTFDGAPVDFAKVQLFRSIDRDPTDELGYSRVKTFNTSSSGRFSFSDLKLERDPTNGVDIYRYRVVVTDRSGQAAKTFREVKPRTGRTVTRNVTLKPGATVTGSVTRSDGGSPAELTVQLEDSSRETINPDHYPDLSTPVAADGSFRIAGADPIAYDHLVVSGGPYVTQCLDSVGNTLVDCRDVPEQYIQLAPRESRVVPALSMSTLKPPTSTVRGRITDTSGRPLKGIRTELLTAGGTKPESTLTRSSGRFTLPGTATGTYIVRVTDPKGRWKGQYLGGATAGSAQSVVVTGGTDVSGLDLRLKSRASVRTSAAGGNGSATIAFSITRAVTGSRPSGTVTLTSGDRSASARVTKGTAKATLTGLPAGQRQVTATYSGTSSTASFTKTFTITVR